MAAELVTLLEDVKGDYQSRTRIVVDELSGHDQLGLLWGIRCRHYSADATAALSYAAQALDPLDAAANATVGGESVVRHANLGTNWTPVLGTNIGGTAFLTHTGSYRAWARVYTTSAVPPNLRFVYDVGDLTLPEESTPYLIPGASNFYLADLGQIRLDQVPVGTHRWQGQIQAKGASGGENLSIRKLWFQPFDEGAGKLVAAPSVVDGLVDYAARDEFNQTAGALTGKTLPVGGPWAGAGDADDFVVDAAGHDAQRWAVSDADLNTGRYSIAGSATFTDVLAQVDVNEFGVAAANNNDLIQGVIARYTDASNWLLACKFVDYITPGASQSYTRLYKRVAGTTTLLASVPSADRLETIRLLVDAAGRYFVWAFTPGSNPGSPRISGSDPALATGGALATGKCGFYDAWTGSLALIRWYDNFLAFVPTPDAILFANQSAELRTDGMYRETADGSASGPVSSVSGDLPRLPPSGLEGRPSELLVITTRGDFDQLPDTSSSDTIAETVKYRPSYLFAPAA